MRRAIGWSGATFAILGVLVVGCAGSPPASGVPSTKPGATTAASTGPPLPDLTAATSPTPVPVASAGAKDGVFRTVLVQFDGSGELPITLQDLTGLVTGIGPAQRDAVPFEDGVANPDGRPDVLTYRWTGGACDILTSITFERAGEGSYRVSSTTKMRGDACILIGIGRGIDIHLVEPLDADSVVVDNG